MQVYRCSLLLPCFSHQCQVIHLVRLGVSPTSCLCGECASSSVKEKPFQMQREWKFFQGEGATKDMGKMLGGDEEKDPDAAKKEEERQEALRQEEEERKAKYAKMEAEREVMRQGIRDKVGIRLGNS
nr:PREDICTED: complexin-1-like [Pelecanus crispus]